MRMGRSMPMITRMLALLASARREVRGERCPFVEVESFASSFYVERAKEVGLAMGSTTCHKGGASHVARRTSHKRASSC